MDCGLFTIHLENRNVTMAKQNSSPLRILYVTRVPFTAVRFILPLARRLRDRGHRVEFAFGQGEGLKEMEEAGFRCWLLSMERDSRSFQNLRVVPQLGELIRGGQYHVVHTYSPFMGLYGRVAAWRARVPVVIHSVIGSLLAPGVPLAHRLMYIASELATSRMVDLFITLNDADARTLTRYRLASARGVVVLRHEYGVSLREFDPALVDRIRVEEMRKRLGVNPGEPVIGFVGRMIGAKGILDLFEAFRIVRAKGVAARLIYVGDVLTTDKDRESVLRLKDLVVAAGLGDDVRFVGFQKDIPFYLSVMDVVVQPSHHEGFARIPVEAGAMGVPAICTAVPGAHLAIEDGKTGFIVPIRNPRRLAGAIEKAIADTDLLRHMGARARQRAVDLVAEEKIVDEQVRVYEQFFKARKETEHWQV